jgi:hypothetical protein
MEARLEVSFSPKPFYLKKIEPSKSMHMNIYHYDT